MLDVDFSPWLDGPPIPDDCSQSEGLAYSDAVRQLQEKSQRGLSKEMVKQWGAHFKDRSCERCLTRRTQCVWRVDTAGCQACHISKLRCSKVERYASRLIAARLGLPETVSWARFQKWGKIRRPGGGRKPSIVAKTSPKANKPRASKGKTLDDSQRGRPPSLHDSRTPPVPSASHLLKRALQGEVLGPSVKRARTQTDEAWDARKSSRNGQDREGSGDEEDNDVDESDVEPSPGILREDCFGGRSESINVSFQTPPSPLSFSASPSIPPMSPKLINLEAIPPLPDPLLDANPVVISPNNSNGNLFSFGHRPPTNASEPQESGNCSPFQTDYPSAQPPRYPSPSTTPYPSTRSEDDRVNDDPDNHREQHPREVYRPHWFHERSMGLEAASENDRRPDECRREMEVMIQRERGELEERMRNEREVLQAQLRTQREAMEQELSKRQSALDARLEESESGRVELQTEVDKVRTLVEQERRSLSEHADELSDFRHAYSVLLQGATEAGYALQAGSRYHTTSGESASHEARAQNVLQDAIVRAMDVVLPYQRDHDHTRRERPAQYSSQGSDGCHPVLQVPVDPVSQGSSSQRRHSMVEPHQSQSPAKAHSMVDGTAQQSKVPRRPGSVGSPQSCSASLHPRMRRVGVLGRDESLYV